MKAVYKYKLTTEPELLAGNNAIPVDLPVNAKALSIENQFGNITLWALVDIDAPKEQRVIMFIPTGMELPNDIEMTEYITTRLIGDGAFVYHAFIK